MSAKALGDGWTLEHLNRALHEGKGFVLHDLFMDHIGNPEHLQPEDGRLYQFLMSPDAHLGHLTLHPDTGRVVGVGGALRNLGHKKGYGVNYQTFHGPAGISGAFVGQSSPGVSSVNGVNLRWPQLQEARGYAISSAFPPLGPDEQHLKLHEADGTPVRLSRQEPTIREQAEALLASGRMPSPDTLGLSFRHIAAHEQPWGAVSSSTRENSTYAQALQGLRSPEFHALESDTPEGTSGIGLWTDGAEETRFLPAPHKDLLLHLGAKYRQKAVLLFTPGNGPHTHHKLTIPTAVDPGALASRALALGIPAVTILPHGTCTQLHIVDPEGTLTPAVQRLAKETNAHYTAHRGTAEFLTPSEATQGAV